jgi:hypothetical protein
VWTFLLGLTVRPQVYFHTFGCRANQYDTDVVRQRFRDEAPSWSMIPRSPTSQSSIPHGHQRERNKPGASCAVYEDRRPQTIVMGSPPLDDGSIAALPSVRSSRMRSETVLLAAEDASGPLCLAERGTIGKNRGLLKSRTGATSIARSAQPPSHAAATGHAG